MQIKQLKLASGRDVAKVNPLFPLRLNSSPAGFQDKKHLWRNRVRQEFDTPVKDLILAFARDGYSKRLTAGAIGITGQTLLAYCRREGIQFPERKDLREECKPKPSVKGNVNNPWGRKGKP